MNQSQLETASVVADVLSALKFGEDDDEEPDYSEDEYDDRVETDEEQLLGEGLESFSVMDDGRGAQLEHALAGVEMELMDEEDDEGRLVQGQSSRDSGLQEEESAGEDALPRTSESRAGTVEEALRFAGGFGQWQWEHFVLVSAAWFCSSIALYARMPIDDDLYGTRGFVLHSFEASGAVLGAGVWGYGADTYGRMKTFYLSFVVTVCAGILGSLVSLVSAGAWSTLATRFLVCFGALGFSISSFVVFMEYLPYSHRLGVTCVLVGAWSVAESAGTTMAVLIDHPGVVTAIGTLPSVGLLAVVLMAHRRAKARKRRDLAPVAESARWLLAEGKDEAAVMWMVAVALRNQANLDPSIIFMPEELRVAPPQHTGESVEEATKEMRTLIALAPPTNKVEALCSPVLWRVTVAMMLVTVSSMSTHQGSVVLNEALPEHVEIVSLFSLPFAQLLAVYATNFLVVRHGRRKTLTGYLLFMALFNAFTVVSLEWTTAMESLILVVNINLARFSSTGTTIVTLVLAIEVFPTVVRGTALGATLVVGWFASMVVVFLSLINDSAMVMVGIVCSVLAAPLGFLWIPETKRVPLPDVFPDTSEEEDLIDALYASGDPEVQDGIEMTAQNSKYSPVPGHSAIGDMVGGMLEEEP